MSRFLLWCLLIGVSSVSHSVPWGHLTLSQKDVLMEYQSVWHFLRPDQQQKLEAGAFRFAKAIPEDKIFFQEEYEKWLLLAPEDRRKLERRWSLFKALSSTERNRIKIGLSHLKKLPREKQESIRYLLREAEE
tara:strand:- start:27 stop:425 length:399 start_codon:yes stop_codon:yes gene_type:complete